MRLSFFTVRYHSNMRAFVDGKEVGKMPVSHDVEEGHHQIMIKHLTNFRWKTIIFDLIIHKHTDILVKYSPFWGTIKVYVDNIKINYLKK